MKFLKIFFSLGLLVAIGACNDGDQAADGAKKGKPSAIFADYRISGEEGKEAVTCLLQFYEAGPRGATLLLQNPATVQLDGETLKADSTPRTGVYYELQKPLQAFKGPHTFTLTDEFGQMYKNEVPFEPLQLQTPLGEKVKGDSLVLQVAGLLPGEKLRVVLADIDFNTPDINRLQTAPGGKVVLTPQDLQQVAAGPVTLMLYKEVEKDLKDKPAAGGRLTITYGLTREFVLEK